MDSTHNEPEEMIRKVYAADLVEKTSVHTVFRVTKKQKTLGRSGKVFFVVTLTDRTGEIDARIFDEVDKLGAAFAVDDYVLVKGEVISFHGHPQVVISHVERLDPEPIDPKEFTLVKAPETAADSKLTSQLKEAADRLSEPHLKRLLNAFLEDPAIAPGLAFAAKGRPPRAAQVQGALQLAKLCLRVAEQLPNCDRDLLVTGALLSELGGFLEYSPESAGSQSDEGRLLGGSVLCAQKIRELSSKIPGFPEAGANHLMHLVLCHPGEAGRAPVSIEALILQRLGSLQSELASWQEILNREPHERWADAGKKLGRHLWRGGASRRRKEREPRPVRPEKTPPPAKAASEAPAPKERDSNLPKELAFKPFDVLAPQEPAAAKEPQEG